MVGIGRACLFGDFLSGARGWLGGIGDWGLVLWNFFFFVFGNAAQSIFTRRDGFCDELVMGG